MTKWSLLAAAIASEVTASLALKAALDAPAFYLFVAIGYIASFAFLTAVLRHGVPLGVAYGIWGALGVATTAIMSALIFDEALTPLMGLGMVLVIAGVLGVKLGSHVATHQHEGHI
jgi:small multidrug resistance pump